MPALGSSDDQDAEVVVIDDGELEGQPERARPPNCRIDGDAAALAHDGDLDRVVDISWTVAFERRRSARAFGRRAEKAGWTVELAWLFCGPARCERPHEVVVRRSVLVDVESLAAMRAQLTEWLPSDARLDCWQLAIEGPAELRNFGTIRPATLAGLAGSSHERTP